MRIKDGYSLRNIAGENMVIMGSELGVDITRVIVLNDSAAWLWEQVVGRDFTDEEAVKLLLGEYEVEQAQAQVDVARWVEMLNEAGAIEL